MISVLIAIRGGCNKLLQGLLEFFKTYQLVVICIASCNHCVSVDLSIKLASLESFSDFFAVNLTALILVDCLEGIL